MVTEGVVSLIRRSIHVFYEATSCMFHGSCLLVAAHLQSTVGLTMNRLSRLARYAPYSEVTELVFNLHMPPQHKRGTSARLDAWARALICIMHSLGKTPWEIAGAVRKRVDRKPRLAA